jgi:hypothetical protein
MVNYPSKERIRSQVERIVKLIEKIVSIKNKTGQKYG